jgi:hypothetical protein
MRYDSYGRHAYTIQARRDLDQLRPRVARVPVLHLAILGAALALVGTLLGLW